MSNIKRLPLDVLEIILLYAVGERFASLEDWKEHIPLVGVCKKWTSILRPVVFSTAYIYYNVPNSKSKWMTNEDFISIRGWYNNVKTMNIRIEYPNDGMLVMNQLQNTLQLDKVNWMRISRLYINFIFDKFSCSTNSSGDLSAHIVDFTQMLISKMPNIISLRIRQYYEDNDLQQLIMLVVCAYSAQLKLLELWPMINIPATHLGSNLTNLTLGFESSINIKHIFSVCAEPLCELHLQYVSVHIPWHIFYGNSEPGQINFKNLKVLSISYSLNYDNSHSSMQLTSAEFPTTSIAKSTDYTYKLLFPKLEVLKMNQCPDNAIASNFIFGSTLKTITLWGNITSILKWVTIPKSTQTLVLSVIPDVRLTFTESTNMLNNLLNVTSRYQYRILELNEFSDKVHLSSIVWGNINELNIVAVDVSDILTLLSKTPRLEKLTAHFIDINNYKTVDQVKKLFQQHVDTWPLTLALKTLDICYIEDIYDDDITLAVIYNFMTHTKLLFQIIVPEQFVGEVMMIIEAQKAFYPHFSTMQVFK